MAEKVLVTDPTTGGPMDVSPCVIEVPCSYCRAPRGVPCRGSRWEQPDRKGVGAGNTVWWWQDTHYRRRILVSRIRRNETRAWLEFHEATVHATMEPHNCYGEPVDVDEADYDGLVEKSQQPLEDHDEQFLENEPHPSSVALSE